MKTRIAYLVCAGALAAAAWLTPPAFGKDAPAKPEMSEKRIEKLKKKLELTDDQAAKLKEVWAGQKDAMKPAHEKLKKAMEQLRAQVKDKASDKDIEATLAQLKAAREEMRSSMEKKIAATNAVLTPTQRAKMVLRMAKKGRKKGGWFHRKDHDEGGEEAE